MPIKKKTTLKQWMTRMVMNLFPKIRDKISRIMQLIKLIKKDLKDGDIDAAAAKIDELLNLAGDIINP